MEIFALTSEDFGSGPSKWVVTLWQVLFKWLRVVEFDPLFLRELNLDTAFTQEDNGIRGFLS